MRTQTPALLGLCPRARPGRCGRRERPDGAEDERRILGPASALHLLQRERRAGLNARPRLHPAPTRHTAPSPRLQWGSGFASPSRPGTPVPPSRPAGFGVTTGILPIPPQKSPGNGSLREALIVPQGKLMDPGSLPTPDSEGKEPERQTATLPTTHALNAEPGTPALFPKRLPPGDSDHFQPLPPQGGSLGSLGLPLTTTSTSASNSIIHPSDLFQDLSHFQETWLAEGE